MSASLNDDDAPLDDHIDQQFADESIGDKVVRIKKEVICPLDDNLELPFKCSEYECNRSFNTLQGLQVHLRKHQLTKKSDCMHVCPANGCDRMFNMTSSLRRHISCMHEKESSKDKPFLPTIKSDIKMTTMQEDEEADSNATNEEMSHSVGLALQTINQYMIPDQEHQQSLGQGQQIEDVAIIDEHTNVIQEKGHGIEILNELNAANAAREIVNTSAYDEAKLAAVSMIPDIETIETGVMRSESVHENLMKRYRCRTCDITFANVSTLMKHRELVHPDQTIKPPTGINQYSCKFCDKVYRFALGLQKHVLTEHPSPSDNVTVLTCDQCPRKFLSSQKLENHVNLIHSTGPKPEGCKFCSRRFATRSHAAAHERTHTGARPYACYVCKRSFTQKSVLTAHMLIHTGVRRFICKFCGRAFSRSHHLDSHYRTHTGERNYKCEICLKMYTSPDVLRQHQRVHTGERPFTCATCGSKFKMSAHLAVHQLTHNGIKKYCCSVCNKRFARLHHLERHHMTHTGEKPFTCEICGRSYNQTASLKYHRRTAHPDQVSAAEVAVKPRSRDYLPTNPIPIELKQNGTIIEVLSTSEQIDLDGDLTATLLTNLNQVRGINDVQMVDANIHVQGLEHSTMQSIEAHENHQQHHQHLHQQQHHQQHEISEGHAAANEIIIEQSALTSEIIQGQPGQQVVMEQDQLIIEGGEQSLISF